MHTKEGKQKERNKRGWMYSDRERNKKVLSFAFDNL